MNATATVMPADLVKELLAKISDLTGISPSVLRGDDEDEEDDEKEDEDDEEENQEGGNSTLANATLPVLCAAWQQTSAGQARMHPALAFCAGVASTVAAIAAVTLHRQRVASKGVRSGSYEEYGTVRGEGAGLSEAILSERERLARV